MSPSTASRPRSSSPSPPRPDRRNAVNDPDTHPARAASQRSMAAVEAGDRAGWLALFAPDAVVEDPIGPSMFDPDGSGHRGAEGIAAFYDTVIGPNQVRFAIRESY